MRNLLALMFVAMFLMVMGCEKEAIYDFNNPITDQELLTERCTYEIELDIKPTSCPNPLNMKSGGVLPIAILGAPNFPMWKVDPSSIRLEGVAPIRYNLEDVAAPVPPPAGYCECTTAGPDGYMDMTFKFNKEELIMNAPALQGVEDGEVVEMTLTGNLMNGRPFVATDCVVIKKKGNI